MPNCWHSAHMVASVDTGAPTCGGLCGRNSQPEAKSIGKFVLNAGGGEEYANIVGPNGAADISQWLTDDESDANNSTGLIRTRSRRLPESSRLQSPSGLRPLPQLRRREHPNRISTTPLLIWSAIITGTGYI